MSEENKNRRSWVPYIAQGVTNAAHFAATNIGNLAKGDYSYATLGLNAAQFVLKLRELHVQIEELAKEVNEAIHYIDNVEKWTARVETCDTPRIQEYIEDLRANIKDNYLNSTSFLQRLIDTDRRAMAVLKQTRDVHLAKRVMEDTFLNLWPEFYRNDLLGRMTRLVEMVKASIIQSLLKTAPSACQTRKTLPKLRVEKAPLAAMDEFVAHMAVHRGGRKARSSRKTK